MECQDRKEAPSDFSNCFTVQLPNGDSSSPAQSLQHLLDSSNEEEVFQRQCECCGRETTWTRKEVLDTTPDVLCIRVNRFIVDMTTYSVKKNTVQSWSGDDCIDASRFGGRD